MSRVGCLTMVALLTATTVAAAGPTCDDLSGIDFGPCDAVLGYGVIQGECQLISGCESPVPLFPTAEECQAACDPRPTCDDLSGIDFGPCEVILGFGVLHGECALISGCESPVPLFASLDGCAKQCEPIALGEGSWGRVKALYRVR